MNQLKKVFAVAAWSACVLPIAAQYPVIPDSVKARGERQQEEIDRKSDEAWAKALPVVMSEAAKGRPYKPWAAHPEDLIKSNPRFPGSRRWRSLHPRRTWRKSNSCQFIGRQRSRHSA